MMRAHRCETRPLYGQTILHRCRLCSRGCCQVVDGDTEGCAVQCRDCKGRLHRRCARPYASVCSGTATNYGCHECVKICETCHRSTRKAMPVGADKRPFYQCRLCDKLVCCWCFLERHPRFCVVQTMYNSLRSALPHLPNALVIVALTFLFGQHPHRFAWPEFLRLQTQPP